MVINLKLAALWHALKLDGFGCLNMRVRRTTMFAKLHRSHAAAPVSLLLVRPCMRRMFLSTLVLVPLLLVAFAAGAITSIWAQWGFPIATVHVKNESARMLDTVKVRYTTCGITRTLIYSHSAQLPLEPAPKKLVSMQLVLCGEGSHTTETLFSDGHILKTKGSYIQGGSVITERITDAGISSEYTRTLP